MSPAPHIDRGDVIVQVDANGHTIEVWLVTQVKLTPGGILPEKVRRSGRPPSAVEEYTGWRWRYATQQHHMKLPPEQV